MIAQRSLGEVCTPGPWLVPMLSRGREVWTYNERDYVENNI